MSKRDTAILLQDIREALDKITFFIAGMDREMFMEDVRTVDAVVRNLEVIGEATKQLPDEFKASHQNVPWAQLAGLRNRIVHDYAGIDIEIIWQIIVVSVPQLRLQLADLT